MDQTVAVIGAGVSGLTAAYLLAPDNHVTLFEADPRLGGHAHTHQVPTGDTTTAVDSGFIVHNDRTYPLLRRIFSELAIQTRPTEMSMSISSGSVEYAGGRGLRGFVARPRQLLNRDYLTMLASVRRFHRLAREFLDQSDDQDSTTYGELISDFPTSFIDLYAVPLVSCVWSSERGDALAFPARYLLRFLDNHGMLSVKNSPQWLTVVGGSATYVEAISQRVQSVRTSSPVTSLTRTDSGVQIGLETGARESFDRVVVATHADQALRLLADASTKEKEVLGAFRYSRNETILHRDLSLLPRAKAARASWNYSAGATDAPVVTYWMNRLQGLDEAHPLLVTLNARERIDPDSIIAAMDYFHPVHDLAAVTAQQHLAELNTSQIAFAGAYHGWGFHEDGCRSGVAAAHHFGAKW